MASEAFPIYMWVVPALAGWMLTGSAGVCRWCQILTGREPIRTFRSDRIEGADWYRRAMSAHRNCVENIALDAPLALVGWASGIRQSPINNPAVIVMVTWVAQSATHVSVVETNLTTAIRFASFLVQVICFVAIGWVVINHTPV